MLIFRGRKGQCVTEDYLMTQPHFSAVLAGNFEFGAETSIGGLQSRHKRTQRAHNRRG